MKQRHRKHRLPVRNARKARLQRALKALVSACEAIVVTPERDWWSLGQPHGHAVDVWSLM